MEQPNTEILLLTKVHSLFGFPQISPRLFQDPIQDPVLHVPAMSLRLLWFFQPLFLMTLTVLFRIAQMFCPSVVICRVFVSS